MNLADIFYITAIIWMIVNVVILVGIGIFLITVVKKFQMYANKIQYQAEKIVTAKYSIQLMLLKHVMKFLRLGGEDR